MTTQDDKLYLSEFLADMAGALEKSGWCQKAYKNKDGQFCVLGSAAKTRTDPKYLKCDLKTFAYINSHFEEAIGSADDKINYNKSHQRFEIVEWNDRKDQTAENVISVIKQASEKIKKSINETSGSITSDTTNNSSIDVSTDDEVAKDASNNENNTSNS
jgi:hypothetical protein